MMKEKIRILFVGLEEEEVSAMMSEIGPDFIFIHYHSLPKVKLAESELFVESSIIAGKYLYVDKVVFHGIYENDFDFLSLLALWGGPCLPNASGMMDLRPRIPGLIRALKVSKFYGIKRGMLIGKDQYITQTEVVSKWGVWHCGEDKQLFTGNWESPETALIEEYIVGNAVRIMMIGEEYWQINLTGSTWLKSIHNEGAGMMDVDQELLADSMRIAEHFKMEIIGVDYIINKLGERYLLEVNHVPNVTVFPFVNKAYIAFAMHWLKDSKLKIQDQTIK